MLGIRILIIVASVSIVFITLLYIFQSRYVYYPERTLSTDPSTIELRI